MCRQSYPEWGYISANWLRAADQCVFRNNAIRKNGGVSLSRSDQDNQAPVSVRMRGRRHLHFRLRVEKVAIAFGERRDRNLTRVHSLGRSRPLIISEEEDLVPSDRSAESPPKLVLLKCPTRGRKVVARIEVCIAQELENIAVKCIGTGLSYNVDLAAAELAVFGIEVIGENPKFINGIEVGNDRRPHVDVFFDIASIDHKAVGKFPLAVNRDGAGIQISGGRERGRAHVLHHVGRDGSGWRNPWLKRKQIRKAPSVEGYRGHPRTGDDLAYLRTRRFNQELAFGDGNDLGSLATAKTASTVAALSASTVTPVR